jgi:putative membrane protein
MNPDLLIPELTSPEVQAFAMGFPLTLMHAGITVLMLLFGSILYALLTPYKEISAIRDGNAAAAVAFGGVIVALAVPLAVSLQASTSWREIVIWGLASVLVQLLVFRITDFVLAGLPARVQEGEVSAAVLLVAAKLACAIILAAAVAA